MKHPRPAPSPFDRPRSSRLAASRPSTILAVVLAVASPAPAADDPAGDPEGGAPAAAGVHLSRFGAGAGPSDDDGILRLLDRDDTFGQRNAVAFDLEHAGPRRSLHLRARLRVLEGGDGGSFLFLNTAEYGARGPAPFLRSAVEPNLRGAFAVGVDVHDPKDEEMFGEWGNYQGLPEREVSLHFDGRELVKRVAPAEFRGAFADLEVRVDHVCGGAEVTVRIGDGVVYDRYFVAELLPYECRLAIAAGTRADVATRFDVRELAFTAGEPAPRRRPPLRVEVFNHVLTDNDTTSYEAEVDLPPAEFAFGRVLLTLDIHDAGPSWDEWDRNGHLYVTTKSGEKYDLVPFITSYRTPCHWVVDVTHFRPWLEGRTAFSIHAGTGFYKNRGFMMSVSLAFHHGTPDPEPYRVVPLWHGRANYRDDENHFRDFFDPRDVEIPAETTAARVTLTTTGHSQVGEFTPSARTLVFVPERDLDRDPDAAPADDGGAVRFENVLWKTDVYLNPNRPQFGTWKFSRAGWAPGDVVRPWWIDLTPHLVPGRTARLRYEPTAYDFTGVDGAPSAREIAQASHVVRAFLVLYRAPSGLVAAPTLRVTNVQGGSAAAVAGVKAGDYLAAYDGTLVDTVDALRVAKDAATAAGKATVPIVIYRGAERLELEVATGQLGVNLGG